MSGNRSTRYPAELRERAIRMVTALPSPRRVGNFGAQRSTAATSSRASSMSTLSSTPKLATTIGRLWALRVPSPDHHTLWAMER